MERHVSKRNVYGLTLYNQPNPSIPAKAGIQDSKAMRFEGIKNWPASPVPLP